MYKVEHDGETVEDRIMIKAIIFGLAKRPEFLSKVDTFQQQHDDADILLSIEDL